MGSESKQLFWFSDQFGIGRRVGVSDVNAGGMGFGEKDQVSE